MIAEFGFHGFCFVYLTRHFKEYTPPDFHRELMAEMSDINVKFLEIIGFRGSAKSTIGSLAFVLYAALELPDIYPFIIPIADTGTQASINIANIKNELDNNELLKADYGMWNGKEFSLHSNKEEWQSKNMLLANGVRILARSRGQKVRGLKHQNSRPKLVVIDDPEETEWVRFKENRDLSEKWLRGEVLPGMATGVTKVVLIGNYLHDDALMSRAKKWGIFKVLEYPLLDQKTGKCLWPSKFPTQADLDQARAVAGEQSWQREYLMKVVAPEGAPVTMEDIQYYDQLPEYTVFRGMRGHGVDFAISMKESADYTTCVDGDVYWVGQEHDKPVIHILPNPLNAHMEFHDQLNYFKKIPSSGGSHIFFPEDVAYQKAAIQEMERAFLEVHAIRPTTDKLARLRTAATYIKRGQVLFPRHGCEDLINQIVNFGVESHDDLADGLSNLIIGFQETSMEIKQFVRL